MAQVMSTNVPDEVADTLRKYAEQTDRTVSYILKKVIVGNLSLKMIEEELSREAARQAEERAS